MNMKVCKDSICADCFYWSDDFSRCYIHKTEPRLLTREYALNRMNGVAFGCKAYRKDITK
jgi:hypothetical protein